MMRFLLTLCLVLPLLLTAQEKPIIFPEDVGPNTVGLRCYCKPGIIGKSKSRGIDISYRFMGESVVESEDEQLQQPFSRIRHHQAVVFKIKAPVFNRPGFKLLVGYNHQPEVYHFSRIGADYSNQFAAIDGQRLKNNAFSITTVNSFTSSYFSSKLKISSNGDYNGFMKFQKRYMVYNLIGVYGVKKREDLEWGVGLSFSHSFRRNLVIPFFIFNRSFNDRWGFESVLPALMMVRYNANPNTIFLGGLEFNSRSFSIDVNNDSGDATAIYHMNHSEINALVRMERHIVPWLWTSAEIGFQKNFNTDFESPNEDLAPSFMVEAKDNLFFKIGFFISPPDKFYK